MPKGEMVGKLKVMQAIRYSEVKVPGMVLGRGLSGPHWKLIEVTKVMEGAVAVQQKDRKLAIGVMEGAGELQQKDRKLGVVVMRG